MHEKEYIIDYYNNCDEDNRLTSKHGIVEFLTTMRYIEKYIKPGMKILEIGAGTGRYSLELAKKGYEVTSIELVPKNIEVFKEKVTEDMNIHIVQGNALNLSNINDETYDLTLLLGPMYHLYTEYNQLKALSEAFRVTKIGGILYSAYCNSDATILNYGFIKHNINNLINQGLLDAKEFITISTPKEIFQLHRKEDIYRLMNNFNIKRLHYVATDLATQYIKETIEEMSDEEFKLYLKYHFFICEREDMVGLTSHSLDIVKKLS